MACILTFATPSAAGAGEILWHSAFADRLRYTLLPPLPAAPDKGWLFWTDGITTLLSATLLWAWFGQETAATDAAAPTPDHQGTSACRDRSFLFLLLGLFPGLQVFSQTGGLLPLWVVNDLGFSPRFFGLMLTWNTLLIVLPEVGLNLATSSWARISA